MKSQWWSILFIVFAVNASAESCKIEMADISQALQSVEQSGVVTESKLKDPNSGEPIRRYVLQQSDGVIVIVEQKHCLIHNLTITLLLPEGTSFQQVPERLANILTKIPEWNQWFGALNAKEILNNEFTSKRFNTQLEKIGSFTDSLDKIVTPQDSSEANLRLVTLETETLPFHAVISLYLGVGGE